MVIAYDYTKTNEYGTQECWGFKFNWTAEHLTADDLEPLIHTYDTIATSAAERLDDISKLSSKARFSEEADSTPNPEKKVRGDLFELLQEHASTDEVLGRLWGQINEVPGWVDWEQIERGQKVFYRYGGPAITALTFLSLLGGMGSGRTVETLNRTGGFAVDVVRRRLLETIQHTLNVTRDLESIKPGGDGFVDSIRVRLLHAAVRRRIMEMAKTNPEYYDMKKLGIPINDLDCIGTISTFSATLVWMGLPRQGIWLRKQEIADYLALWRYVAYLMGTPHDWISTPESARRMMESLLVAEIRPSKASANLANNIIAGLEDQPPTYASREFMCAQTYWLNGRELSRQLGIEAPGLYYSALVLGQCILFMATSYVNRSVSYLDERNIKLIRKALPAVLLHDKSKGALGYTARFTLKHEPSFARPSTERGGARAPARTGSPRGSRPGRAERVALGSLLAAVGIVGGALVWVGRGVLRWVDG